MIVAAPASGQGKTTVVTGLLGAMRRRGTEVAPFKVGPDYIDPGYHRLAAGRPARNLDPVLVGEDRIAPLFRHGSAGAELSIVEGVMGLFDGRIGPGDGIAFGSTAHVAQLLNAPVVLVVDARGQSHSLAALLHGFRSYRPEVTVAGVILNRVASERHEQVLRDAADNAGLPVLGAIPRAAGLAVPSRHLGLVTAAEHGSEATRAVDAMTDIVARSVDLEAVRALACSATELPGAPWNPREEVEPQAGPVVAVAGGRAFTFAYAEHVELLEAAVPRSPCWTRSTTSGCRSAPPAWCCRVVSPNSMSLNFRRTPLCARKSRPSPLPGRRSTRNAVGCCTWPRSWTDIRCAACSTRGRGCRRG